MGQKYVWTGGEGPKFVFTKGKVYEEDEDGLIVCDKGYSEKPASFYPEMYRSTTCITNIDIDISKTPGGTKFDDGKTQMGLLLGDCHASIKAIADVLSFGARKYAPRGWRAVAASRYLDAMYRHLNAWHAGEANDPESGLPHLAHVATNVVFLMELEGKSDVNDRESGST